MRWFQRKSDPIAARSKLLESQISELESQIQQLSERAEEQERLPRVRSTVNPKALSAQGTASAKSANDEPIFERVSHDVLELSSESESTTTPLNGFGVKKLDPAAVVKKMLHHIKGTPVTNSRFIDYLAAGSIQGLRPLRYERRIARNRFLAMFLILLFTLVGIFFVFRNQF